MTFPPVSVSRRFVMGAALGAAAASALRPLATRAAEIRFASNPFTLGVASGYPEPNAIVLWTRLAPEPLMPGGGMPGAPVAVDWGIASDERFTRIVRSGTTYATPDLAHSVHVEATGLEPAHDYWYRFTSGGARSATGHTRTAPAMDAPLARYAADHPIDGEPPEIFLPRRAAAYQAYYEHLPLPRRMLPRGPYQFMYTQRSFGDLVSLQMLDGRQYRSYQACGSSSLVQPCAELYEPQRTMLGREQEKWLEGALGASRARWNVLGQQTLMAHFNQSDEHDVRYWADGWNGYPAARARLVDFLAERRIANPIVLSGDIHAFLVNDLNRRADDAASPIVATELVATSISSPARPQRDFDRWLAANPNVRLARSDYRGYLAIDATPERLHADLVAVDDVARKDSGAHVLAAFDVEDGKPGVAR